MIKEKIIIFKAIQAARNVQTFLWNEANGSWGLEEWKRMFRKRLKKIDEININNPHAIIEFKKRLLQNAALCIALINILNNGFPKDKKEFPSNLEEYKL
jgi:hypothetical protein